MKSRHPTGIARTIPLAVLAVAFMAGGPARADTEAADAAVTATLDADGVQRASMVLDSYSYSPSHLIVQVDKPVELTLTRASSMVPHNIIIDDPESGLSIDQDVPGGKSVILSFTPTRTGRFVFYCDKSAPFSKSHREKGMEGILEVR